MQDHDFRETLYTIDKSGTRRWVYADVVRGFFRKRRELVMYSLLLVYLVMPWIPIGGSQAIFFDIAGRKLDLFGFTFWATDTRFLFLLLGILGLSLFFFSALLGRVWCGWACPETVFLEFLFRPIERLIEGGPVQRQRLDSAPMSWGKLSKKATKWVIFAVLAWLLASTFLAYFFGRSTLLQMMLHSPLLNPEPFIMTLAMMGVALFQFGWFREQFCTVLCPYARFQSVLLDPHSLVVGYDKQRGEPRGKVAGHGDCVDCHLCVRVCPTGIDIRNGIQLECIHCAACVDACDSIMDKLDRPRGLIRYDTETGFAKGVKRIFRPRIALYGIILAAFWITLGTTLATRSTTDYLFIREVKDATYTTLPDGRVSNHWKIHLANKGAQTKSYAIRVQELTSVEITSPLAPITLTPQMNLMVPLFFNFPPSLLQQGRKEITVELTSDDEVLGTQRITLLGPG